MMTDVMHGTIDVGCHAWVQLANGGCHAWVQLRNGGCHA